MSQNQQYLQVERAIGYLKSHCLSNPSLSQLAAFLGASEFHVQRVFKQWVGITPKQYVHFLLGKKAVSTVCESDSVMDASWDLGLSSTSRLHDLLVKTTALTPAEVMAKGAGVTVYYGFSQSPLGEVLLGWTDRGICWLSFVENRTDAIAEFKADWVNADLIENPSQSESLSKRIFSGEKTEVSVVLSGSNLQLKVWEALVETMPSDMMTYSDLAIAVGLEKAYRAVATAVAQNKIAYLIPCHRVIRAHGDIGSYRWGKSQKQKLFLWEKLTNELPAA